MKYLIHLLIALCTCLAHSAENEAAGDPPEIQIEKYSPLKLYLPVPASLILGFGIGQIIQNRTIGVIFTVADAVGYFGILLTFGDCSSSNSSCQEKKDQLHNNARNLLIGSRLAQVIDASVWTYNYYDKFRSSVYLMPEEHGASLNFVASF